MIKEQTVCIATDETKKQGYNVPNGFVGKYGYFFTKEQLNNYTEKIIKESLEIAYKNAKINYDNYFTTEIVESESNSECSVEVNEASITNSFNEIYEKLKQDYALQV